MVTSRIIGVSVGTLLVLFVALVAASLYFSSRQVTQVPIAPSTDSLPLGVDSNKANDTPLQVTAENEIDTCTAASDAIIAVVDRFEALQKARNGADVLKMFTPPEAAEDAVDFNSLSGEEGELGQPRLYNNVQTNYDLKSYAIAQSPLKLEQSCLVTVEEKRLYHPGPVPVETSPIIEEFMLVLVQESGQWRIDTYQSTDEKVKKGKFSGFNRELIP